MTAVAPIPVRRRFVTVPPPPASVPAEDTRAAVRQLLADGHVCLPVRRGTKAARVDKWSDPTTRWSVEDFWADDNVGIRLDAASDVDLDCREAREAARRLLPVTPMTWGRPSNGVPGHYLYRQSGRRRIRRLRTPTARSSLRS